MYRMAYGMMVCVVCLGQVPSDGLHFESFQKKQPIRLLKDARIEGRALRLNAAKMNQTGAAWAEEIQAVSEGFDCRFRFQLGSFADNDLGGADGFAFVIQTVGANVIAGRGAAGGFSLARGADNPKKAGIARSLAIFFDTWKNQEEEDESDNSIGVFTNGDGFWLPRRLGLNARLPIHLKDGKIHTARIVYRRPQLSVFLDDSSEAVLSAAIDIASVVGNAGKAYVGFTAATGSGFETHDILSWDFQPGAVSVSSSIRFEDQNCLPNRTLCTPAEARVEKVGEGIYRVQLPAHLEWGASLDHVGGIKIKNLTGTVCWNAKAAGNHACNGAEGDSGYARQVLVDPGMKAGTLTSQRRGGKVYFSVNAPKGEFAKNEGYFEFEVELIGNE